MNYVSPPLRPAPAGAETTVELTDDAGQVLGVGLAAVLFVTAGEPGGGNGWHGSCAAVGPAAWRANGDRLVTVRTPGGSGTARLGPAGWGHDRGDAAAGRMELWGEGPPPTDLVAGEGV